MVAAYLFEVIDPIVHPVPARRGDIIAVRPGHPTRPVVVFRCIQGEWLPVTMGPPNYGAFLIREDEGFIRQIFAAPSFSLALHPLARQA